MAVANVPQKTVGTRRMLTIRRKNHIHKDELSILGTLLLIAFAIVMFFPFVLLIGHAFMTYGELFHFPPIVIPYQWTTQNFYTLILALNASTVPFSRYAFNSILVSVSVVMGVVMIATIAAYPLSKMKQMPGRGLLWFLVIASLMYSGPVAEIPRYLVVTHLHLINTEWALILPSVVSSFGLFLMRQFVDSIPDEIIEAARIDGASDFRILFRIIYPATQPAWATLIMLTFIAEWGNAGASQLYLQNQALKTLPVAFTTLGAAGTNQVAFAGAIAAAGLIMALPPVIVFLVFQARVIQTMAFAGLKG